MSRRAPWVSWTADLDEDGMLTWESQVVQYPVRGPAGISYLRGDDPNGRDYVDCLLFRGPGGDLWGILNHYPVDFPPWERAGNVNVWVRRDKRRRGIASRLVDEARRRWDVSAERQRYSDAGSKFIAAYLARRPEGSAPGSP